MVKPDLSHQNPYGQPSSDSDGAGVENMTKDIEPNKAQKKYKALSIIPATSITIRAVSISVAIMAFLACLTTGFVFIIWSTAQNWASDVSGELTVQIREVDGVEIENEVQKALTILKSFEGISNVRVMTNSENEALLEPWLGRGLDLSVLPIPRLIIVSIDTDNPPILSVLSRDLARQVAGVSIDNHRLWLSRLRNMANTLIILGVGVLCLVLLATVLTIVFATRGAVASSREVVAVLDLVGANENFIANQFEKHFLRVGIQGGLIGGGAAIAIFWFGSLFSSLLYTNAAASQLQAMFGDFALRLEGYVAVLLVLLFVILLATLTSRFSVLSYLKQNNSFERIRIK